MRCPRNGVNSKSELFVSGAPMLLELVDGLLVLVVQHVEGCCSKLLQLAHLGSVAGKNDRLYLDVEGIALGMRAPVLHLQAVAEGAARFLEKPIDIDTGRADLVLSARLGDAGSVLDLQGTQAHVCNGLGRSLELAFGFQCRDPFVHPAHDLRLGAGPRVLIDLIDRQASGHRHEPPKGALRTGGVDSVSHELIECGEQGLSPFAAPKHHQVAAGASLGRRNLLLVVQRCHDTLYCLRVEVRQEQVHVVQCRVLLDAPRQWRTHHPAQQLGDVRVILGATERHHDLRPWAVPPGGEAGLEEHHADVLVRIDAGGFDLAKAPAAHVQIPGVMQRVRDLAFIEATPDRALDHGQGVG